ncbi:hypothetical protein HY637_00815 [Candidatus Woesearchaeota archaeon]|nr:hypothetical protein [Candidatus Woesearchaeota archaeon]MBI4451944.1 hypothetical protein [Candidatus Woesearchaeota archaeon]
MSKKHKQNKPVPAHARQGTIKQTAQELDEEKKYLQQELEQNKAAYEGNIKNLPKTEVRAEREIRKQELKINGNKRVNPYFEYERDSEYLDLEKQTLLETLDDLKQQLETLRSNISTQQANIEKRNPEIEKRVKEIDVQLEQIKKEYPSYVG